MGAIVHLHILDLAFLVIHGDLLEERHEGDFMEQFLVVLRVLVALGGAIVVIERHTGTDHVEQRRTAMRQRRFQQSDHLFRIAGEGPADEVASQFDRHRADVDRGKVVHLTALGFGPVIRRR